jgi:putative addiction module killer protein
MALEMVFNELSLDSPAPNIAVAQQWMQEFIDLVRAAQKLEIRSLRTHSGLNQAQLASNYSIAQWRNDPSVDRERQRFFKSLQTKSPFIDLQTEPNLLEKTEQSEFLCQNLVAAGLGVAFLIEALAVSFPSAPHWQAAQIQLQYSFLDPDTIDIISQDITVPHASEKKHLTSHHVWIETQNRFQSWTPTDQVIPSYSTTAGEIPIIDQWLKQLSDIQGREIIIGRLTSAKKGNLGDYKDFDGILELRIHYGCGYRIYCSRIDNSQIMVLVAGRKSEQPQDILKAKKILEKLKKEAK